MFSTRQLVQSAFVAATIAAAAPVHADSSFATGGYARFTPEARYGQSAQAQPVVASPGPSFATGGYARVSPETIVAPVAEPAPSLASPQPSFATGGFSRQIVSDAVGFDPRAVRHVAGYPWDNGGYKSDGWRAPADAIIVATYPWDNGGYRSDGWRAPELRG